MRLTFLGPATVHLQSWIPAFKRAGVEVSLVTCHRDKDFRADFPVVGFTSRLPSRLNLLWYRRSILRTLDAANPDLVVAYYASSYGFVASGLRHRPYVVVTAGSDVNVMEQGRRYLAPFVRRALRRAAAVVCWSESLKHTVASFGVAPERIFVLPRGINIDRYLEAARARRSSAVLRLICIRRFRRIFHHETLVDACAILRDQGVPFELTLCGDGTEREAIENQIRRLGLTDRIKLLGQFRHEDIPGLLGAADVYVALPEIDGASASLFEAMSAGVYPLVSDIPANRQWIRDGVNGTLVSYSDPAAVAAAIARLVDPASRVQAVDANLEFATNRLDIRRNTEQFVRFFEDVLERTRGKG